MTDTDTEASLAFGTAIVALLDEKEFRELAKHFMSGCDPEYENITLTIGDELDPGWSMFAVRTAHDGTTKILLRHALTNTVYARNGEAEIKRGPEDRKFTRLKQPISVCGEYVVVSMAHAEAEILISQGTCIIDEDEVQQNNGDTWTALDYRLFEAVPTP